MIRQNQILKNNLLKVLTNCPGRIHFLLQKSDRDANILGNVSLFGKQRPFGSVQPKTLHIGIPVI